MSNSTKIQPVVNVETVEQYRVADRAEKARIRKALDAAMKAAIESLDIEAAASAKATLEAALETSAPTKVEIDPRQVIAQRVADLRLAATMLEQGTVAPAGLEPVDVSGVEVEADTATAVRLAEVKITRSGERRSIADVIERAFSEKKSGDVLTIAEIARLGAVEGYAPSHGAISNRIKEGFEGLVTIERDADGPLRARKA